MSVWLKYIRSWILLFSLILSVVIYTWVQIRVPSGTIQIIKLTQLYALVALSYLYIALLATPLTQAFPSVPGRGHYIRARRAIGQSTFYFALLHSTITFWGQLGGFTGLGFLNNKYLLAIGLSFVALVILSFMMATSFNRMVSLIGYRKWKLLHRCVYVAGILILIHALMLGTHFSDLSRIIPQIFLAAIAFLLVLEAIRIDTYLSSKRNNEPEFAALFITVLILLSIFLYTLTKYGSSSPFGIHNHY